MTLRTPALVELSVVRLHPWLDGESRFMQAVASAAPAVRDQWKSRLRGLALVAFDGRLSAGVAMDVLRDMLAVARADEFPTTRWHCSEPTRHQQDELAAAFRAASTALRDGLLDDAAAPKSDFRD